MELYLGFGVFMGTLLFGAKFWITSLALQHTPKIKSWIYRTPLALVCLDTFFGYLGMHVAALAGGTIISMVLLATFTVCSCISIMIIVGKHKFQKWITC